MIISADGLFRMGGRSGVGVGPSLTCCSSHSAVFPHTDNLIRINTDSGSELSASPQPSSLMETELLTAAKASGRRGPSTSGSRFLLYQ